MTTHFSWAIDGSIVRALPAGHHDRRRDGPQIRGQGGALSGGRPGGERLSGHRLVGRHRVRRDHLHVHGRGRLQVRICRRDAGHRHGRGHVFRRHYRLLRQAAPPGRRDDHPRAVREALRPPHPLGGRRGDRAGWAVEHGRVPPHHRRVPGAGLRLRPDQPEPQRAVDDDRPAPVGHDLHGGRRHALGAGDRFPPVHRDEFGPDRRHRSDPDADRFRAIGRTP